AADRVVQRTEKRRAAIAKRLENRELARVRITVRLREDTYLGVLIVRGVRLWPDRRRQQPRQLIGEVQRDASVALAERLDADPHDFTRRRHRIEVRRIVDVDA